MRQDKKVLRQQQKLAAMFGIEVPKQSGPLPGTLLNDTSREAEAVLAYKENPELFIQKKCTYCNKDFAVNRANVANCSDFCRAKELEAIGIVWDWSKSPELRWGMRYREDKLQNEPLVIQEQALDIVQQILGTNNNYGKEVVDIS